jgi:hypothetical protein
MGTLCEKVPYIEFQDSHLRVADSLDDRGDLALHRLASQRPPTVEDIVLSVPKPLGLPYRLAWDMNSNGLYTVSSCYNWFLKLPSIDLMEHICNWIWKLPIMEKIRFMIWLV